MKEKFVESSISFIEKYEKCDDLKLKKLRYGLEGIYSMFIKLFVAIIISCITNTLTETLLFLLFYSGIRTFSYGAHAKTNLGCWFSTITIYNIIPFVIKKITIPSYFYYIAIVISFISVILWAPADTPKKPLIRKKERIKCKILSIIVVIIYSFILTLSTNIQINNALSYALIIESIFLNPLTYKLLNIKFNSYKTYELTN